MAHFKKTICSLWKKIQNLLLREREREKVSGRLFREKYFPLEKSSSAAAACEEDISYVTKQYDQMME